VVGVNKFVSPYPKIVGLLRVKPEVEKNADIDKEVTKIVAYTVKTYDFKNFSYVELNNLLTKNKITHGIFFFSGGGGGDMDIASTIRLISTSCRGGRGGRGGFSKTQSLSPKSSILSSSQDIYFKACQKVKT
jgi:hypothetical protein